MPEALRKRYVRVEAWFGEDGVIHPTCVLWGNGTRYEVDKVIDIRPCLSLKVGGGGLRYTVRIGGGITYLFQEGSKWFVEEKVYHNVSVSGMM